MIFRNKKSKRRVTNRKQHKTVSNAVVNKQKNPRQVPGASASTAKPNLTQNKSTKGDMMKLQRKLGMVY